MRRLLALILVLLAGPAAAETQYIAALGYPNQTHGTNANEWGLWQKDPGPRGVWLQAFPALQLAGMAPAGWRFDASKWWLEEHGLIMEAPEFPLAPGTYVVTGGRQVTTTLTIGAPDASGAQTWALADGATLEDVTHLACRSAVYTADNTGATCTPASARSFDFPVSPGAAMPAVSDCVKQDYNVLFVVERLAEG